ncbi:ATP-dependent DNA helicase [Myceligenerans pegani]|uniref:DNA 5'-3' helicase n=1 Tax=Myceligenerans pegani TaxID=2776917 RepID=A0ABR9MYF4_9MICO|nr:ATP-dependent DNA helicase [Myceligenerans sp. TRM 65318]MBE1876418.1 ATP-dependent DNA helicase [Myceligenerans sp. TRM 65318]MBE3018689.1 ATP-dependent DNA helicase [Myceligenerans sp. TRM 65318]
MTTPTDTPATSTDAPEVDDLLDLAVGALGGGRREGQHRMARAVTEAIESGEHLLVQAGTGTGKSLGYLVPAVRHAVSAGDRVVVSTATLALQRQVITRDLPLVAEAVAPRLARAPRIALLKGWHNYLCKHKVGGGYPGDDATLFDLPGAEDHAAPEPPGARTGSGGGAAGGRRGRDDAASLADHVRRLHAWAAETNSGDRDDLVPGVPDKAWRQVSVTALECLGSKCPMLAECFPDQARAAAREADVVVTNHAMLGIAASGNPNVLPEHDVVVVDEAHELVDRVTASATVELSAASVEHAARLARRHGGADTTALEDAGTRLGTLLVTAPGDRFPRGLEGELRDAVAAVRDAARAVLSELKPEKQERGPGAASGSDADPGLKLAQGAVLQLFEVAERMAAEDTTADVLWLTRPDSAWGGFGESVSRLHAAPLHVAGLIRTNLLGAATGVLTSATLALGGTFEPIAGTFGLGRQGGGASGDRAGDTAGGDGDGDDEAAWTGIDVGSPFDYGKQGICYIARHLPAPGREPTTDAQLDEIAELVTAAGGRTLGLFSSRRAATAAAEAMRERLDLPILAQGDDQLPTLVREFADDPATCLFGTLSLWQGVDVPGPSCQLVLIDRIPFPRPDDPVKAARARAIEQAGGNGFMAVSAAHAALLLAQGAGRLIRGTEDRGVVAVLDPRLATARYASFLVRSMPAFWPTTDPKLVRAALARLDA